VEVHIEHRELLRIRRILGFIVGRDREALDRELEGPAGDGFWQALDSYGIPFDTPPEPFEKTIRTTSFDHGRGAVVQVYLWAKGEINTNVMLTLLIEFKGDIPTISILNLRIP
jgi:hypothetical protein